MINLNRTLNIPSPTLADASVSYIHCAFRLNYPPNSHPNNFCTNGCCYYSNACPHPQCPGACRYCTIRQSARNVGYHTAENTRVSIKCPGEFSKAFVVFFSYHRTRAFRTAPEFNSPSNQKIVCFGTKIKCVK